MALVNLRKNLFLPNKKASGYRLTSSGWHTRDHDAPRTPADRVKAAGIMLEPEHQSMEASDGTTDVAKKADDIQRGLIRLAAQKTQSQTRIT